ncbi:heavy-metal-associated domain-containing protein [Phytoactinopolyspora alkaliphila]|uniref:Heavy-metal-associated domain-containing protein n=1 Tax=Phytoactinopolyspora alkaliphila TaxID=1783498 RepID=A0A6N9YN16_9ACTN|nr:heavy metal-associated domain-containing protein [Phytoactinopolyspora alkaliphila]NED96374.1 heavy-metal-associated domain-containing protein [Phytoactinopolyspora alkaliphila]
MCDIATTYQVAGMTCGGCATKVETAVGKLPGATATVVDLDSSTVTVHGHVSEEAVHTAIAEAGYTAAVAPA